MIIRWYFYDCLVTHERLCGEKLSSFHKLYSRVKSRGSDTIVTIAAETTREKGLSASLSKVPRVEPYCAMGRK